MIFQQNVNYQIKNKIVERLHLDSFERKNTSCAENVFNILLIVLHYFRNLQSLVLDHIRKFYKLEKHFTEQKDYFYQYLYMKPWKMGTKISQV